jgi:hypothetical protein
MISCGLAQIDITPPVGYPLAGFAARKGPCTGIHDPLKVKALVVQSGESAAIVTCDLISFPTRMVAEIRERASKLTGIPAEAILLSTSHTHSGPALDEGYGGQGVAPEWYWKTLVDAVSGSIHEAWLNRVPARTALATGTVQGVGVNRRNPDGKPVDPQVAVLRVKPAEGGREALLFNYTCHAVVLGPDNRLVTADYPGYAVAALERLMGPGVVAMFTNGAAGDVNTGHSADLSALGYPIPGRTFERAERLGHILAGAVFSIAHQAQWSEDAVVRTGRRVLAIPSKELPSLADAEKELAASRDRLRELEGRNLSDEALIPAKVKAFYSDLLLQRVREAQAEHREPTISVELQAVRIGEALLLAIPVELFVSIGLQAKAASPFSCTAVVGYANGHLGYLPSRETFAEGGYEAVSSRFAPEAAELVERGFLDLARSLRA